jgi:hypothetical protein
MRGLARFGFVLLAVFCLAGLSRAPGFADSAGETAAWKALQQAPSDPAIVSFLETYPESPHRQDAATMLARLRGTSPADVLDQYGSSRPGSQQPGSQQPDAAKAPQPAVAMPAALPAPKQEEPAPVGTFLLDGRTYYDDHSGFYDWQDTLVLNADGTAELTTKYRVSLYSGWHLNDCPSGTRVGTYLWKRKYTTTVTGSTVTLYGKGPAAESRVDPICWDRDSDLNDGEPWVLTWFGGRLSSRDGAYVKRSY